MAAKNYFSTANILCPINRERCMKALKLVPSIKQIANDKKAAVLVPLCISNGEMSLLFTLRSKDLASHAGHVSFPGGKFDLLDNNLVTTALRETEEELGIPRTSIDVWGEANSYPSKNFDLAVTPVIGYIKNFDNLKIQKNPAEVEEVFTVSLQKLADPQYFGFTTFKNGWTLPVFMGGPHKIWGLTSTITHLFLSCLLPKEAYTMQFQHIVYPSNVAEDKSKL